jgi:hypothetical protein
MESAKTHSALRREEIVTNGMAELGNPLRNLEAMAIALLEQKYGPTSSLPHWEKVLDWQAEEVAAYIEQKGEHVALLKAFIRGLARAYGRLHGERMASQWVRLGELAQSAEHLTAP